MDNMAGRPRDEAERAVRDELAQARIAVVPAPPGVEVFAHLGGAIGRYTLRRAWYYWIVTGLIPLEVAEPLYKNPTGRRDVRAGGHCGRPHPRGQAVWLAPDGRTVIRRAEWEKARDYAEHPETSDIMAGIGQKIVETCVPADVPAEHPGARGYVENYHIDSQAGLCLFADAIRSAGLDGPELPEEHARVKANEAWAALRRS